MNQIKMNTAEKELYYQGDVIVKYVIEYPEIISSPYELGKQRFNQENRRIALSLKQFAEGEFYRQAKETYEYNKKNGYPIMVYELMKECYITFNYNKLVSLYCDEYTFSGGAHGSTIRSSQNWDLELAKQIPLQDFYPNQPDYILKILQQINEQIAEQIKKEGESIYFPDYCQLVIQTFNLNSYYLIPKGIMIFFQQYDIAPYSSGIREFLIQTKREKMI